MIIQSNDSIAPVGYINLLKLHLESKSDDKDNKCHVKGPLDFINDINESVFDICTKSDEGLPIQCEQPEKSDLPELAKETESSSICVCIENAATENSDNDQLDDIDSGIRNYTSKYFDFNKILTVHIFV